MPTRQTLDKKAKSNTLHEAADQKSSGDHYNNSAPMLAVVQTGTATLGNGFTNSPFDARMSQMLRLLLTLVLVIGSVAVAHTQQRPLLTDDIDITPPGSIEIGAGVDFFQNAKFPLSGLTGDLTRVGDIRLRTGFAPNVELQIEGALRNYLAINSQGAPPIPLSISGNSTSDFDDFTISAKIKLRNETNKLPAIGFKFGYQMPNTNQARGIGTNQINVFGKIIAQKKFGSYVGKVPRFTAIGNLGMVIMTAPIERFTQNDLVLYGLAGIFRATNHVNIVSEINGRMNTRGGAVPLGTESVGQFRIGAQVRASSLRFDTAAAFGLTKYSPRSGFIFGVTYQSPTIFTPAK